MTEERTPQYEKTRQLQRLLQPGEQLLWHGAPAKGLRLQKGDFAATLFSFVWCGFAICWEIMAITSDAGLVPCLFGLIFVVVGLYLVVGRFFHDAYIRKNTYYGITDQRVIFIEPKKVNSIPYGQIPSLELVLEKGDLGSVFFAPQTYQTRPGKTVVNTNRPGIRLVPNVAWVYNTIQAQMMHRN